MMEGFCWEEAWYTLRFEGRVMGGAENSTLEREV
jgi:hypothetical protein